MLQERRAQLRRLALAGVLSASVMGPLAVSAGAQEAEWAAKNIPGLDSAVVQGACKEGALSLYNVVYRNELRGLIEKFQKAFPCVKVSSFAATGSALQQRFTSEQQAGRYEADIWETTTPGVAPGLAQQGLLANYVPPNADRVPRQFKQEGIWYAVGIDPIGIAWNTRMVTDQQKQVLASITKWSDIANPAFKDSSGVVTAHSGGTAQLPWYYFKTELGLDFYKKLAELKPALFDATSPSVDRLIAGDFAVLLHSPADNSVAGAWVKGAPLQWKFPSPGLAVPHFVSVVAKAPHPSAARLFVAWSLSPEGQQVWSSETGLAPVGPDVKDLRPQTNESWYKLPTEYWDVNWVELTKGVPQMVKDFDAAFAK